MTVNGSDYDAPRPAPDAEPADEPLSLGPDGPTASTDVDDEDPESFVLPDADLSAEELTVRVIPEQSDEFTCSCCFLVHHNAQLARCDDAGKICNGCAA